MKPYHLFTSFIQINFSVTSCLKKMLAIIIINTKLFENTEMITSSNNRRRISKLFISIVVRNNDYNINLLDQ